MVVKGYGMGKRSKYKRLSLTYKDALSLIVVVVLLTGIVLLNGVSI
jgi:energy-coupling factor transporter transmembrane protein EcfT